MIGHRSSKELAVKPSTKTLKISFPTKQDQNTEAEKNWTDMKAQARQYQKCLND